MTSLVDGTYNFRDVGGLPAGAGSTRSGVLYRSGNLAGVTDAGAAQLAALGLRAIVDLRDDDEVAHAPSRAGGADIRRVPLFLGSVASFFEQDLSLDAMYRALVDDCVPRVVEAVRAVATQQPVLVHCTVGKDRTGVTVALALAAAGVDEDAVVDDYARTAANLPPERNRAVMARLSALYPDVRHLEELTTQSPAPVMRRLLDDLTERYGSPADYLLANGMIDEELAGLRDALVDDGRRFL